MRSNNTTPTSEYVKKEFNSTLKYVAMATPTQHYSCHRLCSGILKEELS